MNVLAQRIAPDTVNNAPSTKIETQFPALQKTEGSFTFHLEIGKESKPYLIAFLIVGSLILLCLGANLALTWKKTSFDSRETRLIQQAIDDRRLENRQAWRALGIDGLALEDHDISRMLEDLKKKHPPQEHK
jgi:hypothetical protein